MNQFRSAGYFFTTLLMYLGIPLLGWGLGGLGGFFQLGPRLAYGLIDFFLDVKIAGFKRRESPTLKPERGMFLIFPGAL
ncbi:MAG: hypothetical protein WBB69_12460 [Anaerolineales bacterium]